MKKIVLDTNAYAELCKGDNNILDVLSKAEVVYISVIVMGELIAGFKGGKKEETNRNFLEKFLSKSTVETIYVTEETAEIFGEVKHNLKKSGTPIPINDVWIAAHAIETGSVLVTYDAHFSKVLGLRVWN